MKGIKASITVVIITAITCTAIAAGASKRTKTTSSDSPDNDVITGAGTFPGNMACMYADDDGIYYCNNGDNSKVSLYNRVSQESGTVLTPINAENKINSFLKSKVYTAWKEDSITAGDDENNKGEDKWELYVKHDSRIIKIDEGNSSGTTSDDDIFTPEQEFSAYGNYIVYSVYGMPSKGEGTSVAIKLYDINMQSTKVIFSLDSSEGKYVSEPYIYKDCVVWSISSAGENTGDIYLYNIISDSYSKIVQGGKLIDPIPWEDYLICSSGGSGISSIVLLNLKSGVSKDIASVNQPVTGYSVGDGYVAWSSSSMDGVYVYDIKNDTSYELDRVSYNDSIAETLINIKIYGKIVTYTDHKFKRDSGTTILETGKYLVLK